MEFQGKVSGHRVSDVVNYHAPQEQGRVAGKAHAEIAFMDSKVDRYLVGRSCRPESLENRWVLTLRYPEVRLVWVGENGTKGIFWKSRIVVSPKVPRSDVTTDDGLNVAVWPIREGFFPVPSMSDFDFSKLPIKGVSG